MSSLDTRTKTALMDNAVIGGGAWMAIATVVGIGVGIWLWPWLAVIIGGIIVVPTVVIATGALVRKPFQKSKYFS